MKLSSLKYLFKPSYWIMLNKYNSQIDAFVLNALNKNEITLLDKYYCNVSGKKFWIRNYPYNFGNPVGIDFRPSRRTIELLHKKITELHLKNEQKKIDELLNLAKS